MDDEVAELDLDSPEARDAREYYYRKNMEEINATVTRGAAGIEASYFYEQGALLSLAREQD